MEPGKAFIYEKACTNCGRHFGVLHTDLWAYKRGCSYFCSWKCLRAFDKSKEGTRMRKVTLEDKKKAVEIAISGGDPREYLGKLCKAPDVMWSAIRKALKDSDPEKFAQLPKSIKGSKKEAKMDDEAPEGSPVEAAEEPAEPKEPEEPKICKPVVYDTLTVREVEGNFGRYRRSDVGGSTYIDFENADGLDTLSLTVEQWRSFRKEQEKAAQVLGVEL